MKSYLAGRQIFGAIGIAALAVSLYASKDILRYVDFHEGAIVSFESERSSIAVELVGDQSNGGIYLIQSGASVRDLFEKAGLCFADRFEEACLTTGLSPGDRVTVDKTCGVINVGKMSSSKRLALGMPIDLNNATREDLLLVPGIGPKTASKVLGLRAKTGCFQNIDVLKNIDGLGGESFFRIKEYLFVDRASCS